MFWSVLVPQGTIIKTHSTSILHLIKIKLICCDVLILYSVSFSWEISLGSLTSHRLLYYSFCRDLFCTRFLGKGLFFLSLYMASWWGLYKCLLMARQWPGHGVNCLCYLHEVSGTTFSFTAEFQAMTTLIWCLTYALCDLTYIWNNKPVKV